MTTPLAPTPWPCPNCAELLPATTTDCPRCYAPAVWIDLLRALDFAIRRFEFWKLQGHLRREQYLIFVASCRALRDELVESMEAGAALPSDTGLPPLDQCWSCRVAITPVLPHCHTCGAPLRTSEVRLLRYQAFLFEEVERHQLEGRVTAAQAKAFLTDTPERQVDLLGRLERAWSPSFEPRLGGAVKRAFGSS